MKIAAKINRLSLLAFFLFLATACSGDNGTSATNDPAPKKHFASEKMDTIKKAEAVDQIVQDAAAKQRLTDLRDEALTYLALCFSESGGPQALQKRMISMGMEKYVLDTARRLAEIFFKQIRYKASVDAYRMLLDPACLRVCPKSCRLCRTPGAGS